MVPSPEEVLLDSQRANTFCNGLPRTATQKIQRGDLRALACACVDGAACVDTRALKKRAG